MEREAIAAEKRETALAATRDSAVATAAASMSANSYWPKG
jgi:hypothetical protein